nr:hypothetical protein [Kibdelosporangium sp. MJ126-NF4]CTQ96496.1 hypothetical protein [Kibdelosporangium sp. MJ126-NF4]
MTGSALVRLVLDRSLCRMSPGCAGQPSHDRHRGVTAGTFSGADLA